MIAWIHTFMCSWNSEFMKVEFTTIERSRMRRSVVSLTEVGMVLVKSWQKFDRSWYRCSQKLV